MKQKLMMVALLGGMSVGMMACDKKAPAEDTATQAEAEKPVDEVAEKPVEEEPAAAEKVEAVVTAKVGEPAPDFTLMDQDGNEVKLSQFKGKPVVLEWTEKSCPYVVRHYTEKTMPTTHAANGGDEKVVWLAVDSSHFVKAEEVAAWRKEQGVNYPVLLDADGKVGSMYSAKSTPHMFVIDKEGVLRYSGAIDDNPRGDKKAEEITNYISTTLKALEEGTPVETAETKPYGCGVKYKS